MIKRCRCGHLYTAHYQYIRSGFTVDACKDCDPSNSPRLRGQQVIGVMPDSYAAAMFKAMHHSFDEAPPETENAEA